MEMSCCHHVCKDCGAQVVKARLQGGGGEVLLDPRPRVFVRLVRSSTEMDAWLSADAMVEHAGVCPSRAAARRLAAIGAAGLSSNPPEVVA